MRVDDIFASGVQPISFEIFPPKGEFSIEGARDVVDRLSELAPDFISVTYSAGGSGNAEATRDIAQMISGDFSIPSVAHQTCMGLSRVELDEKIALMGDAGIDNVLALRGDHVEGVDTKDFSFAKDLISPLAEAGFCVGAAAYPEGHIECSYLGASVEHLKQKQDAGASFLVTQLFFDNEYYYRFREVADRAGITIPVTCGIMPFLSKQQVSRMIFMCGASLPAPIIRLLARYENDPASLRQAGIAYAIDQLLDLKAHGVDGLHVYTMNQPDIAYQITRALRA